MKPKHLTFFAILLLVVPVLFWTISVVQEFTDSDGFAAMVWVYHPARVVALVGFVLMFYQFLLGARLPMMEKFSPRNKLLASHRDLGKIGFLLILVHGLVMLAADMIDYGRILFNVPKLLGISALFLLSIAVIASWFFKPLKFQYQTWKKMHLLAYLVFPLAFFHAITLGTTVRGYIAVRIQFVILMFLYTAVVVYRILVPPATKPSGKKPATARPPAAGRNQTPSAGRPTPTFSLVTIAPSDGDGQSEKPETDKQ
jgi:DMSO/TMAO reductase YedYZ heme-binding membrane subunit